MAKLKDCTVCGTMNGTSNKFCGECGARFAVPAKVVTKMYLHGSKEYGSEKGEELGLYGDALNNFLYVLYEVEFEIEVDTATGNYKILKVDGKRLIDADDN